jgi:hypothetical protein
MKGGQKFLLSWQGGTRVFCNAVTRPTFASAPESGLSDYGGSRG